MPVIKPQPVQGLLIGEAAKRSGVSAANIRFYEQSGLLAAPDTAPNGYRLFGEADIHRLRFIRQLRSLDMRLADVRSLLALNIGVKAHCQKARNTLDEHLQVVSVRIAELQQLKANLTALRAQCDGSTEDCQLLTALHRGADLLT